MASERLRRFCLCGGSMTGTAGPTGLAVALNEAFDRQHGGPGHGPATPAQAARARSRIEDSVTTEEPE